MTVRHCSSFSFYDRRMIVVLRHSLCCTSEPEASVPHEASRPSAVLSRTPSFRLRATATRDSGVKRGPR